jgi:hypothetical protein
LPERATVIYFPHRALAQWHKQPAAMGVCRFNLNSPPQERPHTSRHRQNQPSTETMKPGWGQFFMTQRGQFRVAFDTAEAPEEPGALQPNTLILPFWVKSMNQNPNKSLRLRAPERHHAGGADLGHLCGPFTTRAERQRRSDDVHRRAERADRADADRPRPARMARRRGQPRQCAAALRHPPTPMAAFPR